MATPVLDIWKSGGWVMPDGKHVVHVQNEEQALRDGALHVVIAKDGVADISRWNQDADDLVHRFMASTPPPEDLYMRFHSVEPHEEQMKRIFGRSKLLNKKAETAVKQYGQPTPANPMYEDKKVEDDLKIKKPMLPGQPGNPPANAATNGPLVEQQASVEKEADRTLMPQETTKQTPGAYGYDPGMAHRKLPIAQPPTREQGAAPSWVTGSKRAVDSRELLDRAHTELLTLATHYNVRDSRVINLLAELENFLGIEMRPLRRASLFNKKAAKKKVADNYGTVEDLQNFLGKFDVDAKVRFISAVSTYPQIELPIYETWNAGGVPTISLDTDPFYNHLEKLNKEREQRRQPSPTAGLRRRRDYGESKVAIGITPGAPGPDYKAVTKDKSILNEAAPAGGVGEGPAFPPAEVDKAKARRDEKRNRTRANDELAFLGRKYHTSMPIQEMRDILVKHGFNGEAMDGIYTGEDGKMHEQCGPNTWISMTWHKMPRTGTWEIVAYLS